MAHQRLAQRLVRVAVAEVEGLAPAELVKVRREVVCRRSVSRVESCGLLQGTWRRQELTVLVNHDLCVSFDLAVVATGGSASVDRRVVGAARVYASHALIDGE